MVMHVASIMGDGDKTVFLVQTLQNHNVFLHSEHCSVFVNKCVLVVISCITILPIWHNYNNIHYSKQTLCVCAWMVFNILTIS